MRSSFPPLVMGDAVFPATGRSEAQRESDLGVALEGLHGEAVGADVDDGSQLEAVDGVRRPHGFAVLHLESAKQRRPAQFSTGRLESTSGARGPPGRPADDSLRLGNRREPFLVAARNAASRDLRGKPIGDHHARWHCSLAMEHVAEG